MLKEAEEALEEHKLQSSLQLQQLSSSMRVQSSVFLSMNNQQDLPPALTEAL